MVELATAESHCTRKIELVTSLDMPTNPEIDHDLSWGQGETAMTFKRSGMFREISFYAPAFKDVRHYCYTKVK